MRGTLSLLLIATVFLGCQSRQGSEPVVAAPVNPPAGTSQPEAPAAESIQGKVLERLDASPYCYLRLKTAKGEVWAAVPEAKIAKGAEVTVVNPMLMSQFESKTLNRTFPQVYFGNLAGSEEAAPAAAQAPMANPHAQLGSAPSVEVGKVDKATGPDARTVAEVWAQKASLKGKTVTIRGRVVRYNAGVMGKNWMHLQDGTGEAAKGTHDITVTSQDSAAKGDVVTIQGVLRLDKDFGSGYAYAAIIEDAKLLRK